MTDTTPPGDDVTEEPTLAAADERDAEVNDSSNAAAAPAASPVAAPDAGGTTETDEAGRGARKVREGLVISDKMESTVVVAVVERVRHARYGKTVQRTKKLYAHDDRFEAHTGDRVRVAETRPVSKLKRWRVTEVLERAR